MTNLLNTNQQKTLAEKLRIIFSNNSAQYNSSNRTVTIQGKIINLPRSSREISNSKSYLTR